MLDVKHFPIHLFCCFSAYIRSSPLEELTKSGLLDKKKASEEKNMRDPKIMDRTVKKSIALET